jgi:4-aminobutyrate aminotransferase-like enzyme
MEWAQVFTIVGVNIALIAALATLIVWVVNKLDADVKSIGNRLDGHAMRIDQLYKMFVDLLKERK